MISPSLAAAEQHSFRLSDLSTQPFTLVAFNLCGLLTVLQIEDGLARGIGELEGKSHGTRAMRAQNRGDVGRRIWEEDPGPWCGRRTQETQRGRKRDGVDVQ